MAHWLIFLAVCFGAIALWAEFRFGTSEDRDVEDYR